MEHYLHVIAEKTGSLIATSGRYGGMFSGCPPEQVEALHRFGEAIGMAFQISDDIIDIASPSDSSGKTPGTDLREGVLTLPVLYALQGDGADADRLRELLAAPDHRRRRGGRGAGAAARRARAWRGPAEVLADHAVDGPRGARRSSPTAPPPRPWPP